MKPFALLAVALGLSMSLSAKPLASVSKFNGKFAWVKIPALPAASLKSLANAKTLEIDVTFSHAVRVNKDPRGNAWFTFIVADQGKDWKWHQTSGNGGVPISGGTIKPGRYAVTLPVAGIPRDVLKGSQQTISLGPAASGLSGTAAFTIDAIHGR